MPESVCFSMIFGNALGRSLSPSSNSSWCICFTSPYGSRRKPSADKRNFVVVRPPPGGLVLRSRHRASNATVNASAFTRTDSIGSGIWRAINIHPTARLSSADTRHQLGERLPGAPDCHAQQKDVFHQKGLAPGVDVRRGDEKTEGD